MIITGIYVRVSTQEQAKEGYSIQEQIERLTMYSTAHDWTIYRIYTDAGFTGSNMNRPSLQNLISDVEKHRINKVLVYKLDRLSRSQKDTLKIIEDILLPNHCDFESITERFDTATPFGKAMLGILAVFAQLEREQIRERMTLGLNARVKEGKWKGGNHVPFGYRYNKDTEDLTINEYEAIIIKSIFEKFVKGQTIFSIQKDLINSGFSFKNGKVDKRQINYILKNKTYCGYLKYKNDWYPSKQTPVIDLDTYNTAQIILRSNQEQYKHNLSLAHNKSTALLSGLLYCSQCRARYSKIYSGSKKSGYHESYYCYSRSKKVKSMIKDPNCKNKIYRVQDLDNIILNEIKKLSVDPDYQKQIRTEKEDPEKIRSALESEISTINSQLSRLLDLYALGQFEIDELQMKTQSLIDKKSKIQAELDKLNTMNQVPLDNILLSFNSVLKKGSLEDKRTIIRYLIDKIEIDNDDIKIYWKFS